jgi:hypothetical protein
MNWNRKNKNKGEIKMIRTVSVFCLLLVCNLFSQQSEFPKLSGPYLGQTPPVNEPALFAPGIVCVAISPDGEEIYWSMVINIRKIWFTKLENGRWTKPEMLFFCKEDSYSSFRMQVGSLMEE